MTVKGLKDYIIGQGASQMQMQLEWDGIWTNNKRAIDAVAPRYWAIAEDKMYEHMLCVESKLTVIGSRSRSKVGTQTNTLWRASLCTRKTLKWGRRK
jgi:hypothetical protein